MKRLLVGSLFTVSTCLATATPAYASQWGCTIFLCFASPTNPMAIKDCAAAILKIRPWRKPTCSAVKVNYSRDVVRYCPKNYIHLGGDGYIADLRKSDSFSYNQNDKNFGFLDVCVNPQTGNRLAAREHVVYEAQYTTNGQDVYNIDYVYPQQ